MKEAPKVQNMNGDEVDVEEVLEFLDAVRESGAINMFGARPEIERQFDVLKVDASSLLKYWMETFEERHK